MRASRSATTGSRSTDDELVVRSPFDGHEIDRVPACGADAGGSRGGRARSRCTAQGRCRRGSAPRSSTAPRSCSRERTEEFARIIAEEAAKPIKTARVEARRAVSTFTFAAAEARRLTGEMVPMDASDVGEGKLGVHPARADRRRRRDQPVQLPAQPRRPQGRARDRGRLPGGAQAGVADAAVGDRARRAAARRVRAARRAPQRRHRQRRARSATRSSTTTTSRCITFTGSPEVGWGIRGARRARRSASSSGTTRR